MNTKCMIAGIKLLLKKNYQIETDIIDVSSLIDSQISFAENWKLIKDKYLSDRFCSCCQQYIK